MSAVDFWLTVFVGTYTLGFYALTLVFCLHNTWRYLLQMKIYKNEKHWITFYISASVLLCLRFTQFSYELSKPQDQWNYFFVFTLGILSVILQLNLAGSMVLLMRNLKKSLD
jgi:hypothetical protein